MMSVALQSSTSSRRRVFLAWELQISMVSLAVVVVEYLFAEETNFRIWSDEYHMKKKNLKCNRIDCKCKQFFIVTIWPRPCSLFSDVMN